MSISPRSVNQIPREELESLVLFIVNLRFPGEGWGSAQTPDDIKHFTSQLREETQEYWPELWERIHGQNLGREWVLPGVSAGGRAMLEVNERAREIIRQLRDYLRQFWKASGAENERDRDWYIHRAREYHHGLSILPELLRVDEVARPIIRERLLDVPPARNPIEEALYHLQKRASRPSTSPRVCPADDCEQPYFLAKKKGTKFCSLECRRPSTLASKRAYASKSKGRTK